MGRVSVALKPTNAINSLFNQKDKLEFKMRTGVVYMIECNGDGVLSFNKMYICQTKQRLGERIREHELSNSKITGNYTALANHAPDKKHQFNFDNFKVQSYEQNYFKRRILEMIYIKNPSHRAVNDRSDVLDLNICYDGLVNI